jgi:glycosyltransferase involved in cell wall biosynthesis
MRAWLQRRRIEIEDWLRYAPPVRNLLARVTLFRAGKRPPGSHDDRVRQLLRLCTAARLATNPALVARAVDRAHALMDRIDLKAIAWEDFVPAVRYPQLAKAAILKAPVSEREKGVLYISFENEWARLMCCPDLDDLARRYDLVLAPSGSSHNLVNYVFPRMFPGTIFTQISNRADADILPRISSRFVVVPLYASSWVRPESFHPRPARERDVDLLMVANFAKFKRHFALFRALGRMPGDLRVLLIGQAQDGRTIDTIMSLARSYGVAGRFAVRGDLTHDEVVGAFCRARASVILSRREGSCVVVAESMFADTPVALLDGAEVGSSAFINGRTGRFLAGRRLDRELLDFLAHAGDYSPRSWALEHISCHVSNATLNGILRRHGQETGREWTRDLAPLHWCPDPALLDEKDRLRLAGARADFKARYGLAIGRQDDRAG